MVFGNSIRRGGFSDYLENFSYEKDEKDSVECILEIKYIAYDKLENWQWRALMPAHYAPYNLK